jgi:hypothetical protein
MPLRAIINATPTRVADLSVVTLDASRQWFYASGVMVHNCVGDLLAKAGYLIQNVLCTTDIGRQTDLKILLPVHDAFLFECKNEHVSNAMKIIKACMSTRNTLPGTPYYLKIDVEIMPHRWSDKGYHTAEEFMAYLSKVP